jgi:hypothetical protein
MPPASNGNPPYKGRSEELTTNIADFCNKICHQRKLAPSRANFIYFVPPLDGLAATFLRWYSWLIVGAACGEGTLCGHS